MVCAICGQAEGSMFDRCGEYDGIPLVLERCGLCGLTCCPDCLGEADCCFVNADDFADDPDWSPPGWARVKGKDHKEWQRIDA